MRTRRTWILLAWALLLGLILATASQGCGPALSLQCPHLDGSGIYDPWCGECLGHLELKGCNQCKVDQYLGPTFACCTGPDGGPETCPDAGTDAAITDGGATGCAGDCVPAPPAGWDGPLLLWPGTGGPPPACPSNAPTVAYQGHAGLVTPNAGCAPCTCSAPSGGTCAPPSQITASASPCFAGAIASRDFGPPPAWDGACTAYDSIAAGALCNGAPCADSLTSGPLVLAEGTCTPSTAALLDAGAPSWTLAVLACFGTTSPAITCNDPGLTCTPRASQAPGFLSCIFHDGDKDCPASYPNKYVAYSGFDPPGCAPCSCGAPGSSCKATLEVFEDGACTKPVVLKLDLDAADAGCGDLPAAGVALGSKQLTLAYDPGTCAPGGGGAMDAGPSGASTFCCQATA